MTEQRRNIEDLPIGLLDCLICSMIPFQFENSSRCVSTGFKLTGLKLLTMPSSPLAPVLTKFGVRSNYNLKTLSIDVPGRIFFRLVSNMA